MTPLHVVALSGGKDSTCLALALAEREPRDYTYVCTPTGDELPEMLNHWKAIEERLGKPLVRIAVPGGLAGVIRDEGMLPNHRARFCTRILKIEPYREWITGQAMQRPVVSYVGLRYDEPGRAGGHYDFDADDDSFGVSTRYPLREWKWGLAEVWRFLDERGVAIPKRTDCARCYHQQLGEWWRLWNEHPDIFADAARDEAEFGHTYRSPGRDTWPVALKDLEEAFATKGAPEVSLKRAAKREESRAQCRVCSM